MSPRTLPSVFRRAAVGGVALCGLLAFLGIAAGKPQNPSELSGLASVSGQVDAPKSFRAAKVYLRNTDKRMLYMVYTHGGRYQAMHLAPGNYEFRVEAKDLTSNVQKFVLKAGEKTTANVTLRESPGQAEGRIRFMPYDQLYPPGPGRVTAERLCIRCHGPNFLPGRQWSEQQWNAAIDYMQGNGNPSGAQILPGELGKEDREILVQYLVQTFGSDSEPRALRIQQEMPVDEEKISKAEYIEYYLPLDGPGTGTNDPRYSSEPQPYGKKRVAQDLVFDQQGNVWLTDRNTPNRLVKLDPRTGAFQDFVTPAPAKGIHDLMIDKAGLLWLPEATGPNVDVFDTKTLRWVAAYPLDPDRMLGAGKTAEGIVIDSKHNVYIGFILGNGLSRLDWESKKVKVTRLPTTNSFPYGVVKDNKDNIWIAEFHGSKIARVDAATLEYTEYIPPTFPALIRRLTVDSKNNVWFGLFNAGKLEKLDPSTGKMTEWRIPWENSQPYAEKESPSRDKIWFSDAGQGGALVSFDQSTETFTAYPAPQRTDMPMIRITNDGAIWYTARSAKESGVGVMYPDMTKITTLAGHGTND